MNVEPIDPDLAPESPRLLQTESRLNNGLPRKAGYSVRKVSYLHLLQKQQMVM